MMIVINAWQRKMILVKHIHVHHELNNQFLTRYMKFKVTILMHHCGSLFKQQRQRDFLEWRSHSGKTCHMLTFVKPYVLMCFMDFTKHSKTILHHGQQISSVIMNLTNECKNYPSFLVFDTFLKEFLKFHSGLDESIKTFREYFLVPVWV